MDKTTGPKAMTVTEQVSWGLLSPSTHRPPVACLREKCCHWAWGSPPFPGAPTKVWCCIWRLAGILRNSLQPLGPQSMEPLATLFSSPSRDCHQPAEITQQLCMALQGVLGPVYPTHSGYLCAGRVAETVSAASLASYKVGGKPWSISPQACGTAQGHGMGPVPDT